ncbi:MAG: hypothetical protein ACJ76Y_02175 [Thermoanaerobaculia bacterium]
MPHSPGKPLRIGWHLGRGHFLSYLARTPQSLALLVEAAGPTAQKHVGRLLGALVLGEK